MQRRLALGVGLVHRSATCCERSGDLGAAAWRRGAVDIAAGALGDKLGRPVDEPDEKARRQLKLPPVLV